MWLSVFREEITLLQAVTIGSPAELWMHAGDDGARMSDGKGGVVKNGARDRSRGDALHSEPKKVEDELTLQTGRRRRKRVNMQELTEG